jgi:hypothetical protein
MNDYTHPPEMPKRQASGLHLAENLAADVITSIGMK